MTAPDLRRLSITGLLLFAMASRCSFSPLVVASLVVHIDLHRDRPRARADRDLRHADGDIDGGSLRQHVLGPVVDHGVDLGVDRVSRASAAVAASFAETFFDLISEAISAADRRHRSCMQNSISIGALVERFPAKWKPVRAKEKRVKLKTQRRAQGNASAGRPI